MAQLSPDLAVMFVVLLGMSACTLALGTYLVVTNPPSDERKFVGLFSEKLADEDLASGTGADE